MISNLKAFLDQKVEQYNTPAFIDNDPVCIPHLFSKKQDIEIMGFWASILAWGQRMTIINKSKELIDLMDGAPHDFILHHQDSDLKRFQHFKHRTFNLTDTLYFLAFFQSHYQKFESLESAFLPFNSNEFRAEYKTEYQDTSSSSEACYSNDLNQNFIEGSLNYFRSYFFSLPDYPSRTKKHISSPSQKSTCKRLNMFLRWMVRKDHKGVDFGIWDKIQASQLICPCDLHVDRVARKLGLISRKQTDWQTAVELTNRLREMDADDPVKYDFALFALGIEEKF